MHGYQASKDPFGQSSPKLKKQIVRYEKPMTKEVHNNYIAIHMYGVRENERSMP